jgi:hypothetical protein
MGCRDSLRTETWIQEGVRFGRRGQAPGSKLVPYEDTMAKVTRVELGPDDPLFRRRSA